MSGGRRDEDWEKSPGMDPDLAGRFLMDELQLPESEPDREGKIGRADWSLWLDRSEGVCWFDGQPGSALMLTDLCGPGRRLTLLSLCAAHASPERWMARAWRAVRESDPEPAPGERAVTYRQAARLN